MPDDDTVMVPTQAEANDDEKVVVVIVAVACTRRNAAAWKEQRMMVDGLGECVVSFGSGVNIGKRRSKVPSRLEKGRRLGRMDALGGNGRSSSSIG